MPRVNDAGVKTILAMTIDTTPFIATATLLVDQYLLGQNIPDALLTEIERWWAAHLACIRDPLLSSYRVDDTSSVLQRGAPGLGLEATSYGQQVLTMDPTGILRKISRGTIAATFAVF